MTQTRTNKGYRFCTNPTCEWHDKAVKSVNCLRCGMQTSGKRGRPKSMHIQLVLHSTLTPATHCSPDFSFAQCDTCRALFMTRAKGKLPKCSECSGRLTRIRRIN